MNRITHERLHHAFIRGRTLGPYPICKYYPCHFPSQDCTWCFCPFYPCHDSDTSGKLIRREDGKGVVWSCMNCAWIHRRDVADKVLSTLKKEPRIGQLRLLHWRRGVLRGR